MELELKHLSAYLPYRLMCLAEGEGKQKFVLQGISELSCAHLQELGKYECEEWHFENVLPILRPLKDLISKVRIEGEEFIPLDRLLQECNFNISNMSKAEKEEYIEVLTDIEVGAGYDNIILLISWHFDVFGLIEKGLAIDINTL